MISLPFHRLALPLAALSLGTFATTATLKAVAQDSASSPPAASATASALAASAANGEGCPGPEVVAKRIREAANLNRAEEELAGGSLVAQTGEVLSNLAGFGGLFNMASAGAGVSANKKVADAIAADPCGEIILETLPRFYQSAYRLYYKEPQKAR